MSAFTHAITNTQIVTDLQFHEAHTKPSPFPLICWSCVYSQHNIDFVYSFLVQWWFFFAIKKSIFGTISPFYTMTTSKLQANQFKILKSFFLGKFYSWKLNRLHKIMSINFYLVTGNRLCYRFMLQFDTIHYKNVFSLCIVTILFFFHLLNFHRNYNLHNEIKRDDKKMNHRIVSPG